MPEIGRHRPELWPEPYRFWPIGPAFIAYRADVRPLRIVGSHEPRATGAVSRPGSDLSSQKGARATVLAEPAEIVEVRSGLGHCDRSALCPASP
jgi:hypothetical protein